MKHEKHETGKREAGKQDTPFEKMLYWIPVLLSLVATYLLLHTLYESYDLNFADVEFGDFQLHPSSMGRYFFFRAILSRFFNTRIFLLHRFGIHITCATCGIELSNCRI